jgi:hypothetical protein
VLLKIFFADIKQKRIPRSGLGYSRISGIRYREGIRYYKEDIGKSIEEYNEACKKTVMH